MNHPTLTQPPVQVRQLHRSLAQRLVQRGLTTVEYAIGLLCAAILGLTLFRIFSDNPFFQTLYDWLIGIFAGLVG